MGTVFIKAGSGVLILQTDDALAVLNLHDSRRSSVTVLIDGVSVEIPLGRQLIVSKNATANFEKINPSDIAYRNLTSQTLAGKKLFFAEFSPLSALSYIYLGLKSRERERQLVARRMLKSAAALYVVGQSKKAFKK